MPVTKKKTKKTSSTKKKPIKKNNLKSKLKKENKKIQNKISKKQKKTISFDDHIKDVISKLLNKHKVDGIYTLKIIIRSFPFDKYIFTCT